MTDLRERSTLFLLILLPPISKSSPSLRSHTTLTYTFLPPS